KNILLTKIKTAWNKRLGNKRLGNKPVDQFILTMLESSVHHATRRKSADQYKKHQAIQYVFNQINEFLLSSEEESPFTYEDRKSTRLNSSHVSISYAVFYLKKTIN